MELQCKPAEYGIKIIWMSNAKVPHAIELSGRQPEEEAHRNLEVNVVQQLCSGIIETGEYTP